jgi:hypothetical protein
MFTKIFAAVCILVSCMCVFFIVSIYTTPSPEPLVLISATAPNLSGKAVTLLGEDKLLAEAARLRVTPIKVYDYHPPKVIYQRNYIENKDGSISYSEKRDAVHFGRWFQTAYKLDGDNIEALPEPSSAMTLTLTLVGLVCAVSAYLGPKMIATFEENL